MPLHLPLSEYVPLTSEFRFSMLYIFIPATNLYICNHLYLSRFLVMIRTPFLFLLRQNHQMQARLRRSYISLSLVLSLVGIHFLYLKCYLQSSSAGSAEFYLCLLNGLCWQLQGNHSLQRSKQICSFLLILRTTSQWPCRYFFVGIS